MTSPQTPVDLAVPPAAPSRLRLALIALPPLAAGVWILAIAGLGTPIRALHAVSIGLAAALALSGLLIARIAGGRRTAIGVIVVTALLLAATLTTSAAGPQRWLSFGILGLYAAPLVLPAWLVAVSTLLREGVGALPTVAAIVVALLLALQPDAAQALALCAALAVLLTFVPGPVFRRVVVFAVPAMAAVWAWLRPDPLQPVAHVEGVFALAFAHSMPAGLAVAASAMVLLVGLVRLARRDRAWPAAVAAYYAVLYAASLAGLTPAPMIGYGAGPILGFGLLIALSATGAAGPPTSPLRADAAAPTGASTP